MFNRTRPNTRKIEDLSTYLLNKVSILDVYFHRPPIPAPILPHPDKITKHARTRTNTVDKASKIRQKESDMPKGMLGANVYLLPGAIKQRRQNVMPRALRKPKPEPIPTKRKTRRERFDTIVPKRMADLQKQLILLGNCASSNYQYTQEDVAKLEATLRKWVDLTIAKFKSLPPDLPEFKL